MHSNNLIDICYNIKVSNALFVKSETEGATRVAKLPSFNIPPCLLSKPDGKYLTTFSYFQTIFISNILIPKAELESWKAIHDFLLKSKFSRDYRILKFFA